MRRSLFLTTLATVVGTLGLAAAAQAHVTLQPSEAAAEGFTRLDVRVPNEKDDAGTTKVAVQFPDGFAFASTEPVPGWKASIKRQKLDTPIEVEGEKVTEQVSQITWSGGRIGPGEFQDFGLSVRIPGKAGDTLTFKANQTYDDGEVVRWIGPPDSEEPAPQVNVTAAEGETAGGGGGGDEAASTEQTATTGDSKDEDSKGLAIAALIVGGLGLLAGIGALVTARRRRTA